LGLPVGMLVCASNANNVLTDFLETGLYDRRRELHKTQSPSMDILVSSNLERLLYLMSGDTAMVSRLMKELSEQGFYQVSEVLLRTVRQQFYGSCCGDAEARQTIGKLWQQAHYLCDPHTATGWAAAERYRQQTGDKRPMVVLSTASAYKFPAAVLQALELPQAADEFAQMAALEAATGVPIPENLRGLQEKPRLHNHVIDKAAMADFVYGL
jgi:threonine synthase